MGNDHQQTICNNRLYITITNTTITIHSLISDCKVIDPLSDID